MEDEKFIKVVEEHPKLYPVILGMKRMRELKISPIEDIPIEDIRSFLCEISIAIVRTFAYNKDR
nr:MAG TPA: hypothetical protein [Bacteriophage sp.]